MAPFGAATFAANPRLPKRSLHVKVGKMTHSGFSSPANAGSPIQPSASDVSVIRAVRGKVRVEPARHAECDSRPHPVKKLSSPGARAYPEHEDRHTRPYGATGGADTTPVCESSGRRERRPCRVPSLYMAVCPLALHALSRYPFRFPVQVTWCVCSMCMTAAVTTSSSSAPTSALRAALRS